MTPRRAPARRQMVDSAVMDAPAEVSAHRNWRGWFVGAIAVLLAVALGFLTGVVLTNPRWPADDSAEAGFARDMSQHHGQAVEMAIEEYRTTTDSTLRQLAVDIALTQQAQIGIMQTWLRTWGISPTSSQPTMEWMSDGNQMLLPDGRMPGMASKADLDEFRTLSGTAKDRKFIELMVQHHIGGVHMAEAVLKRSDNQQVLDLAQSIKNSQQYEIAALQDRLNALEGK